MMTITNSHRSWCSIKAARSCKQQSISKPTPRPTVRPSTKKPDLILVQQSNGSITLPDQVFLLLMNQSILQGELGPSKTCHNSCQLCQHYSRADQGLENLVVISVQQGEAVRPGKIVTISISIFVIINIITFVIINITIFININIIIFVIINITIFSSQVRRTISTRVNLWRLLWRFW